MTDTTLYCPRCGSDQVTATAEQMCMVNTGEHYCHRVKDHDDYAKASCLKCDWIGFRGDLTPTKKEANA